MSINIKIDSSIFVKDKDKFIFPFFISKLFYVGKATKEYLAVDHENPESVRQEARVKRKEVLK